MSINVIQHSTLLKSGAEILLKKWSTSSFKPKLVLMNAWSLITTVFKAQKDKAKAAMPLNE